MLAVFATVLFLSLSSLFCFLASDLKIDNDHFFLVGFSNVYCNLQRVGQTDSMRQNRLFLSE
jgi:hypothetical protein